MQYRRDIDGLRALAVMPVVLYHAGFPGFSGGFVGVDVFFVISGFLITSIIAGELEAGGFSLSHFFQRRIRRIFPALFVMLLATALAGLFFMAPRDVAMLGKGIAATSLFASNILFWREQGYFEAGSADNPLLHTWSLGVEEQFYLLFPLFLMLAFRLGRHMKAAVLAVLGISFVLSLVAVRTHPSAAFFLLPPRGWELMLGAALALGAIPAPQNRVVREILGGLGFGLIVFAVFWLDKSMPFPGLYAVLPCAGAACLILSRGTFAAGILSLRPVVMTGLVSYSLYLWHWPLAVFMQYGRPAPLSFFEGTLLVVLSGVMACLSWRYVERPFRTGTYYKVPPHVLFRNAGLVSLAALAMGAGLWMAASSRTVVTWAYGAGFYDLQQQAVHTGIKGDCLGDPRTACVIGDEKAPVTIALVGDSFADAISMALDESLRQGRLAARPYIMHSCPVIAGTIRNEPKRMGPAFAARCRNFVQGTLDAVLDDPAIDTVILANAHQWYMTATGAKDHAPILIGDDAAATLDKNIVDTVMLLMAHGKQVIFVGAAPAAMPEYGAQRLVQAYMRWRALPEATLARDACRDVTGFIQDQALLAQAQRFHYVSVTAPFMQDGACRYIAQDMPLTVDGSHPSTFAARGIAHHITAFLPAAK